MKKIRLGINIDHVATLRNARNENFPNLIDVAKLLKKINVDSITIHLREDRRHIKDEDLYDLSKKNFLPLNLEMAATEEMKKICLKYKPFACCIVPERREELTTEGGLNVLAQRDYLKTFLPSIIKKGIRTSLFVDPCVNQIRAAYELGANAIEIHTGKYSRLFKKKSFSSELELINKAAIFCKSLGMECHAGHGLDFFNVINIKKIKEIEELNVGPFLISNAIFDGLENTIIKFREIIS